MASSSKETKAAASAARARAIELKARERRVQTRNRILAVVGILVAVGLVVWGAKYIADQGGVPDSGVLKVPAAADESGGFLLNQDGSIGGTPPEGAVRLDVYVDLMCPICHTFEQINGADVEKLRKDGTIAVYYHPVSILDRLSRGTHYSTRAAAALATVAEYDPAHFEAFFAALFDHQPDENTTGLSNAEIADIATSAGVSSDAVGRFDDGEFTRWVTDATNGASVDGLTGTPWIRIERQIDINPGQWSQAGYLSQALEYIHQNGVQSYLDAVAAAQASLATPSPTVAP